MNKFSGSYYVDPIGLAAGLALWWIGDVSISILKDSVNFIDTLVSLNGEEPWYCTFIYGPPHRSDKEQFWAQLHQIRQCPNAKWCMIGDVNIVAVQNDKEGGNPMNKNQAKWFLDFIDVAGLIELPIKGGIFTWSNMRSDRDAIAEKLDKILVSNEWSLAFPKEIGILETTVVSDHNLIVLMLEGLKKKRKKEFNFESRWLLEEDCHKNFNEAWSENSVCTGHLKLNSKLKKARVKLKRWSGSKYGKSRQTIEGIKHRLLNPQKQPLTIQTKEEISFLKMELQKLWESEERHWHQRARVNWIKFGDKNTKFFHATTIQRNRKNAIVKIKSVDGSWLEDEGEICREFENHFKKLYTKEEDIDIGILQDLIPQLITTDINSVLCREVTEEEIKKAVFDMGTLKAPGSDGFSRIFYHTFWETIKLEVISTVSEFFHHGAFDESLNKTNIVLIPKMKNPEEVNQFRPISLCNFSLKIITKILASRLRIFLPEIIPIHQSAFVNRRLIHDNIILAHEAFHAMKKKIRGSDGIMALKIDLEKAYDKVDCAACVARDVTGQIINGDAISFPSYSVSSAETMAGVIDRINSVMPNVWESAAVEKDIASLVAPFPFFSFRFVKRECNVVADWVARANLKGFCPSNWFANPPPELLSLL
ncbi:hypothetical protein GQ457_06G008250 [Hibiscus cannabinus]